MGLGERRVRPPLTQLLERSGEWLRGTASYQFGRTHSGTTGARGGTNVHGLSQPIADSRSHGVDCTQGASGVRTEAAPGGRGRPSVQHERGGNRRRRTRLVGAAAASERRGVPRILHGVVRSTASEAEAVMSAPVRGAAGAGGAGGAPGSVGHGALVRGTGCAPFRSAQRPSGSGGERDCSGNRSVSGDWSGKPGREAARPTWT